MGAKGKQDVHESYKESDSDEDEEHETTTIKNDKVDSTHLNNSSLNKTDGGEKEAGAENKDLLILKPNY